MDPVNLLAKFKLRSFTRSWGNRGYFKTLGILAFVRMDPVNVPAKFEVRSFTRWGNMGYLKLWAVPGYAHAPFAPKFQMGFCSDGHCVNVRAKFEVSIALPVR